MVVEMAYKGIHATQEYSRSITAVGRAAATGSLSFTCWFHGTIFLHFYEKFPFQAHINQSII